MNEILKMLVSSGSVEALAEKVGPEAAAVAMHELRQTAPEELRESWPMVIAYARMQAAYATAERFGDAAAMMKAAREQADLLRSVY